MRNSQQRRKGLQRKLVLSLTISLALVASFVIFFLLTPAEKPGGPGMLGTPDGPVSPAEGPEAGKEAPMAKAPGEKVESTAEAVEEPEPGPALLEGTVTGEGDPIAGASVLLFPVSRVEKVIERVEEILPQGEMPDIQALILQVRGVLEEFRKAAVVARTEDDGTYAFRDISPGGYTVLTVADRWLFRYGDVVSLAAERTERLDIDLSRGGTISGRVVGPSGAGLAGLTVVAEYRPPGLPGVGRIARRLLGYINGEFLRGPFESVTADDGSFTLGGLPPATYDVAATAPNGLEVRAPAVQTDSAEVVIYLGDGARVRGYCMDRADVPVEGLRIVVKRKDEILELPLPMAAFNKAANTVSQLLSDPPLTTFTTREGVFRVGPLAAGKYSLSVEEPGFFPLTRMFEVEWGQELDLGLVRLDRGESITGVVTSTGGTPLADARVVAAPAQTNFLNAGNAVADLLSGRMVATADASGLFRLAGIPSGTYRLTATARGYASRGTQNAATGGEPVTLRLEPGAQVAGTVTDAASGDPIAGARVRAGDARSRTDADGSFVLEGVAPQRRQDFLGLSNMGGAEDKNPDPTVTISASARGYLEGSTDLHPAQGDAEIRLQLERAPEILGRVLDPDGQPAAGSLVRLVPWIGEQLPGPFNFLNKGLLFLAVSVTDTEGRFRLRDFGWGNERQLYRVIADHVSYARGASEPFQLTATSAGATGLKGIRFQGAEEEAGGDIEIRLVKGARISATVTDGSQAVPGATVRLRKAPEEGAGQQQGPQMVFFQMLGLPKGGDCVTTDGEGHCTFERTEPGSYIIEAERVGFTSSPAQDLTVEAGEEKEVALVVDPGGEIRGVVVDAQGTGIAQAGVRLLREPAPDDDQARQMFQAQKFLQGSTKSTRAGEDGTFQVTGLPEGTYLLIATRAGYTSATVKGIVPDGADQQRVVLLPAASLTGMVADQADGSPITHFRVSVRMEGQGNAQNFFARAGRPFNNADGRFERRDLQGGTYDVEVAASGYLPARKKLTVAAGEAVEETFLLAQAGRIRGLVVDLQTGAPVGNARIFLSKAGPNTSRRPQPAEASRDKDAPASQPSTTEEDDQRAIQEFMGRMGGRGGTRSASDGSFFLQEVPDGVQEVLVTHPDYVAAAPRAVDVAAGREIELRVGLSTGLSISGAVRDEEGNAAAGRWMFLRGTGKATERTRKSSMTGPDGRFRFAGLEAGPYRLLVFGGGQPRGRTAQNLDVRESDAHLDIVVPAR